jgi:hypothetical protein
MQLRVALRARDAGARLKANHVELRLALLAAKDRLVLKLQQLLHLIGRQVLRVDEHLTELELQPDLVEPRLLANAREDLLLGAMPGLIDQVAEDAVRAAAGFARILRREVDALDLQDLLTVIGVEEPKLDGDRAQVRRTATRLALALLLEAVVELLRGQKAVMHGDPPEEHFFASRRVVHDL